MLTYANKELYFIIHSNKKFQKEFNFVKSITNNIDWNNFLHLKFGEVLNEFKSKLLWRKYVFLQKLLFSFFFSMENNLSMLGIYSHMFYCSRVNNYYADCKYCVHSGFFSYFKFGKNEEQSKIKNFHLPDIEIDDFFLVYHFKKLLKNRKMYCGFFDSCSNPTDLLWVFIQTAI